MIARFCLACGARLRRVRLEGRWRRRCPRCGWTFYANPVPAVAAVIVRRGRVLLTRRARPPYAGTWDAPGGFLEADETPERALRRELREEIGVGVRRARFVGFATDRYGSGGFPVLAAVYRVTPTSVTDAGGRRRVRGALVRARRRAVAGDRVSGAATTAAKDAERGTLKTVPRSLPHKGISGR